MCHQGKGLKRFLAPFWNLVGGRMIAKKTVESATGFTANINRAGNEL
jgi:hypothetical protein